jgi:hypothetical protein
MYILLNLLVDKNLAHRGTAFLLGSLPGYNRYMSSVYSVISDDEEDVPDRIFFHQWHAGSDQDSLKLLDNHLKLLFRRLYMYDWMITEAGGRGMAYQDFGCAEFGDQNHSQQRSQVPVVHIRRLRYIR